MGILRFWCRNRKISGEVMDTDYTHKDNTPLGDVQKKGNGAGITPTSKGVKLNPQNQETAVKTDAMRAKTRGLREGEEPVNPTHNIRASQNTKGTETISSSLFPTRNESGEANATQKNFTQYVGSRAVTLANNMLTSEKSAFQKKLTEDSEFREKYIGILNKAVDDVSTKYVELGKTLPEWTRVGSPSFGQQKTEAQNQTRAKMDDLNYQSEQMHVVLKDAEGGNSDLLVKYFWNDHLTDRCRSDKVLAAAVFVDNAVRNETSIDKIDKKELDVHLKALAPRSKQF